MIKVLKKTFDIIEYIGAKQGSPVLPGEIVDALDLNQPTTIRILKDLVELGYLDQVSRQAGYCLGPLAYWVTHGQQYMHKLTSTADPIIKDCAQEIGNSVLFAVLHGNSRYILSHYNYNPDVMIELDTPLYDDLYETATGRVLLAFCDRKQREKIIRSLGTPSQEDWVEASTPEKLKKCLSKIRKDGFEKNISPRFKIAAFPVYSNNKFIAALGASVPPNLCTDEELAEKFDRVARAAQSITDKLSPKRTPIG